MADPIELFLFILMKSDGDVTMVTFGNKTAIVTKQSSSEALFRRNYEHFFSFAYHLTDPSISQCRKPGSCPVLLHINQKYLFLVSLDTFIIHKSRVSIYGQIEITKKMTGRYRSL